MKTANLSKKQPDFYNSIKERRIFIIVLRLYAINKRKIVDKQLPRIPMDYVFNSSKAYGENYTLNNQNIKQHLAVQLHIFFRVFSKKEAASTN